VRLRWFAPIVLSLASSCTTVTSSPSWAGGTLAEGAPARIAEEEEALKRDTAVILKEPKSIGAKHILIMHNESERKPPTVSRSKEDAKKRAQEALAKARAGENFDQLVIKYSDEPGAAERAGDLGVFEKKVMVKAFSDAAFKLEVGQISEIVETPFGFHIIQRTE
jgi:NIMA-interacting peptidyl-prolyl cis-trans isomerase 1